MTVSIGSFVIAGTGCNISQPLLSAGTRRFTYINNVVATPVCLAVGTGAVWGKGIILEKIGSGIPIPTNTFINVVGTAGVTNVAYQTW